MTTLLTELQKLAQDHCDKVVCVNGALLATDLRALLERHRAPKRNQELDALLLAGSQMANCMYNMAQRPGQQLSQNECENFDDLRKQWEVARDDLKAKA